MIPSKQMTFLVMDERKAFGHCFRRFWRAKNGRSCWRRKAGKPLGVLTGTAGHYDSGPGDAGCEQARRSERDPRDGSIRDVIVYSGMAGGTVEQQARAGGERFRRKRGLASSPRAGRQPAGRGIRKGVGFRWSHAPSVVRRTCR